MMGYYAKPLEDLISQLTRLPGVGAKTARKLAFFILSMNEGAVEDFAGTIVEAKKKMKYCSVCGNFTDSEVCSICASDDRDRTTVCVVESPADVVLMERMQEYHGLYHVLHGVISPMEGVGPDEINLKSLIVRLRDNDVNEVILATNPNVEGEATAMYIAKLVKPSGIKVTRIAHGVPIGGEIEDADEVTLLKALEGRREVD